MAKINFYLNGETIMVSVTFNTHRLRISTGEQIGSSQWKQENQVSGDAELDFKLGRLRQWIATELRRMENDGRVPTVKLLRAAYREYMGRKSSQQSASGLMGYIDRYIDESTHKPRTTKVYQRMRDLLTEYQDETGQTVDFGVISEVFYKSLVKFLQGKFHQDSAIGCIIKSLKSVLNSAFDNGVTTCTEQKKKYFRVFHEQSDQIALTPDEIKSIYELEIDDPALAAVRDVFVLSCHTGLRYSDWSNYTAENIIENGKILRIFTAKTGEEVAIPLHPVAREILSRRFKSGGVFPSNYAVDQGIKKIGRDMLKWNTAVRKKFTYKGVQSYKTRDKWDAISAHTARRSFATNAYRAGVRPIDIMKFTGHRTEAAFLGYIRIGKLENARNNMDHPFFTGL